MATGAPWTAEENAVIVRSYLDMLRQELAGIDYSKAEANRRVAQEIGRSRGSIEYKLQNVSWALFEVNHPFIDGYKPARNLQDALRQEVLHQLDLTDDLPDLVFRALQRNVEMPRVDLIWSITGAPDIEYTSPTDKFVARRVDFVRIEAENRRLGLAGEEAVLRRERAILRQNGCQKLADKVEHVSQTQGDGLGFDILSFDERGEEKYIEVKTTRRGRHWPMLVTRNEVAFSQSEPERFRLYRVHDFRPDQAGLYVLDGDVTKSCRLIPESYRALPA
ncbi:DUF3883 domain-containing protein [Intrasporangium sp. YIM S08009]|uniref:DUF3883 domain-containing protein n=1 Tax=Intrasporangium zincisolvens TaxID=3080018 RepID=UPI002B055BD6|nr:DUF3883 domain-containing protein [Intrasporangium sp. YIM S08009]